LALGKLGFLRVVSLILRCGELDPKSGKLAMWRVDRVPSRL